MTRSGPCALWQVAGAPLVAVRQRRLVCAASRVAVNGVIHMTDDWDWIPYAGAAVTATIVAAGYSLLSWWFGG
jgi:hypothetical protein